MKTNAKNKTHSARFLRQRNFLLFLPLLVLPSVTVIFYLLGGGTSATASTETTTNKSGLNTSLPSASSKGEENWNKMQYYEKAEKDSVKRTELLKSDGNYHISVQSGPSNEHADTASLTQPRLTRPVQHTPSIT